MTFKTKAVISSSHHQQFEVPLSVPIQLIRQEVSQNRTGLNVFLESVFSLSFIAFAVTQSFRI